MTHGAAGAHEAVAAAATGLIAQSLKFDGAITLQIENRDRRERAYRLRLEEEDIIANGVLDKLIRENRITSDMASSLMNDSSYAYDIQRNIFDAAEVIFGNVYSLEKDLSLSDEELDTQLLGKRDEVLSRLREEEHQIDVLGEPGKTQGAGDAPRAGT